MCLGIQRESAELPICIESAIPWWINNAFSKTCMATGIFTPTLGKSTLEADIFQFGYACSPVVTEYRPIGNIFDSNIVLFIWRTFRCPVATGQFSVEILHDLGPLLTRPSQISQKRGEDRKTRGRRSAHWLLPESGLTWERMRLWRRLFTCGKVTQVNGWSWQGLRGGGGLKDIAWEWSVC